MAEVKNVPKLRFLGFTEPWEQRKLGCLIDELKSGLSRMLSEEDIGVPVVRANNINNEHLDLTKDIKYWFLDDPKGVDISNYLIHEKDVLINFINSESKMGSCAIVEKEPNRATIYTTNILRMKLNEDKCDNHFFLAKSLTKEYKDYIKGISKIAVNQASFTTVDFKNFDISLPSVGEQRKIGFFFQQLDNLITLHQRKYETLLEYKKGLLQKMFPKAGETVPEIRFPGFDGAWEEHELVEMFKYEQPTKYIVENDNYESCSKFPVLTANKGFILGYTDETDGLYDKGDVIIFDDFTCDHKFVNFPFKVKSSAIKFLTSKENYDLQFLSKLLNSIDQKPLSHQRHWISVMQPTMVLTPSLEEQQKIGSFFKALDEKIELQKQKVDASKEYKKGLSQQMFI